MASCPGILLHEGLDWFAMQGIRTEMATFHRGWDGLKISACIQCIPSALEPMLEQGPAVNNGLAFGIYL